MCKTLLFLLSAHFRFGGRNNKKKIRITRKQEQTDKELNEKNPCIYSLAYCTVYAFTHSSTIYMYRKISKRKQMPCEQRRLIPSSFFSVFFLPFIPSANEEKNTVYTARRKVQQHREKKKY